MSSQIACGRTWRSPGFHCLNGTNRVPRGPHQIYMTALKSGLLMPPGTESWTLMSRKLGGNVVLLDNKLGSEKKHLSFENVYHLGSPDHTLHSSSVSKLAGIRWNDALKSNCWAIGYRLCLWKYNEVSCCSLLHLKQGRICPGWAAVCFRIIHSSVEIGYYKTLIQNNYFIYVKCHFYKNVT